MAQTLLPIFLGQLVSFDLAILSFTVSLITNQGVDAPLSVSFFSYVALALVFGSVMLYSRRKLLVAWYWYVLLGFVDVQGSYLGTKAYEYTSITSVTLLDCCTIAWAVLLTRLFLGTRYTLLQFFGVGICLFGLALVIVSDYEPSVGGGSNPVLGDALVIAATIFFSVSNVGTEYCAKKKDRIEVMAMIGVFGMLVSSSGMYPSYFNIVFNNYNNFLHLFNESKSLESITWSPQLVYAYVGCTIASFVFSTLAPLVLKMSGATLFNLSLLTSDMCSRGKDEETHVVDDANRHLEYHSLEDETVDE